MRWQELCWSLLLLGCVSGCAAEPKLSLSFVDANHPRVKGETDSYAFPYTTVTAAAPDPTGKIVVSATNHTYEPFRVAVGRNDNWGVKTTVSLTKASNSDMLAEAGVDTKDNRATTIEQIGKVIVGFLPLVGLSAEDTTCTQMPQTASEAPLPLTFDSLYALRACGVGRDAFGDATQASSWRQISSLAVWFGPVPPDALPVQSGNPVQFTSLDNKEYQHGIIYAACRELRLVIKASASKPGAAPTEVKESIYVADPRYFRYVALPYKGKVTIHDQCGTSTTTDATSQPDNTLTLAAAVLAQGKAIKDAVDANEKK